jgi:hypothetical protein
MRAIQFRKRALLLVWSILTAFSSASEANNQKSVFGKFVGTTPCDAPIRRLLDISADVKSDIVQWTLTLYSDEKSAPAGYELRYTYGSTMQGKPGLTGSPNAIHAEKTGRWQIAAGMKSNPQATVYRLDGGIALMKINHDLLHLLDPDGSLMVGNGGWSCSLSRLEAAEPDVDPALTVNRPSVSYRISPMSTGRDVFGVFEGRTPYQRIARELKLKPDEGALKSKWRITLYQDAKTGTPTTYKVEGTAHHDPAREGQWSIVKGTDTDPAATIYRLEPTATESPILLLEGDRNVLFFLSHDGKPLIGSAEFGYTLNRRETPPDFEKHR